MLKLGCSLRSQFVSAAIVLVGIATLVGYAVSYTRAQSALAESLSRELLAVVSATAPRLQGVAKQTGPAPLPGLGPFLLLRPTADGPSELEAAGRRYSAREHHLRALGGQAASSGVYSDGAGLWISAVAPVYDANGRVVALLQADRPVNFLHQQARAEARWLAFAALGTLAVGALLATLLARSLTEPVHELVRATRQLAAGNLDHAVTIDRCDELGELSEAVNEMAAQLRHTRAELMLKQEELGAALNAAHAASRAKSEFLANMSHELRTPLNAVIGYSQMLQEDEAKPELRHIESAGYHLLALITTILDFSKADAGKLIVNVGNVAVDQIIEEVSATVVPLAAKGGNRLEVYNSIPGETIQVDALRFKQSLLNLLSNACKFTEQGTVTLEVHRGEHRGTAAVAWQVTDTGPGIAAEDLPRLFQPFSQVDNAATQRAGGTGLGLALSAELCRLMGGEIEVESNVGVGCTFTIWLPDQAGWVKGETSAGTPPKSVPGPRA